MTERDPRPSMADLTRAALGDEGFKVPRDERTRELLTPSNRRFYVALASLLVVVGVGIAGLVHRFGQDRLFRSDDPAIAFSKPQGDEAKRFADLEDLFAAPNSGGVLRVAHVEYQPVAGGKTVPGFAVEVKGRGVNDAFPDLPLSYVVESDGHLGGRVVATEHDGSTWLQITAVKGMVFMASGESTEETSAILNAMLEDEGITP